MSSELSDQIAKDVEVAWSAERRAACGFQMCLSFGARKSSTPQEIDGIEMGSGFEAIKFLHGFFAWTLFGSLEEGARHIYFDWYNLQGLPGTKETKRPDGSVSYLNDAWHELYVKAFNEAKLLIFCISTPWLDSENCFQELDMLFAVVKGDKNGAKDDTQCFVWIMDDGVQGHSNWARFEETMNAMCEEHSGDPEEWHCIVHDFSNKEAQNKTICKLMHEFTELVSVQKKGQKRPSKVNGKIVRKNYMAGCKAGVPGFHPDEAPPTDLKALADEAYEDEEEEEEEEEEENYDD